LWNIAKQPALFIDGAKAGTLVHRVAVFFTFADFSGRAASSEIPHQV
jgi:hypothetical protein